MTYMKLPLPGSIRGIVTSIVALALLPALALLVYSDYRDTKNTLADIRHSAQASAQRIAGSQTQVVENTRLLLATLADSAEVREKNIGALRALFADMVNAHSFYADMRLHDDTGRLIASARENPPPLLEKEHNQVRLAAALRTFSIFHLSDETSYGRPIIHCLFPVWDGDTLLGVIAAPVAISISASDITDLAKGYLNLACLVDVQGHIVQSYPALANAPGAAVPPESHVWARAIEQQGFRGTVLGDDGETSYFEKLFFREDGMPELTVLLSLSTPRVFADMRQRMLHNAALLACAAVLALFIAWGISANAIIVPIKELFATAGFIRSGDLGARVTVAPSARELAVLADSVNTMAKALEARGNELMAASEAAQTANKAKTDFLATMSHEIRTPMNAILGMTYLARQGTLTEQQRGYLDNIYEQASKLLHIINDILDFSKIEAGKLKLEHIPFDPASVLADVTAKARDAAYKKGLAFSQSIPPQLPERLLGDSLYLNQVLTNLLTNAVRYTEQGEISLSCWVERPSGTDLKLVFAVSDTAGGMTGEEELMLFPVAEQETSPGRYDDGSLLNLAVTRKLMRLMQGEFSVATVPGKGSTVTLRIPFTETDEPVPHADNESKEKLLTAVSRADAETAPARSAPLPLAGVSVLLVEDNPVNQQVAEEILQGLGAYVHLAESGPDALAALRAIPEQGPYPIVLMDLQMPGMDGFAATEKIRAEKRFAGVPVIAMSAHTPGEEWERCLEAGMNDYIAKPIDVPSLIDTVLRWV